MADAVAVFSPGFRLPLTTGVPFEAGTILFYETDGSTPRAVYSDAALTVSLGSTVYTDSAGYPVSASGSSTKVLVYASTTAYNIVMKNAGVTIASHTDVKGAVISGTAASSTGITQAQGDARYIRNPDALSAKGTIDDLDLLVLRDTAGSANKSLLPTILYARVFAYAAANGLSSFAAGTALVLSQATAPVGWTKSTTTDNAAIRITTGATGGSVVGTNGFTTTFASRGVSGTVGGTTLTIGQLATHSHVVSFTQGDATISDVTGTRAYRLSATNTNTATEGSNLSHAHSFTGTAIDMSVKYIDMIICTKN